MIVTDKEHWRELAELLIGEKWIGPEEALAVLSPDGTVGRLYNNFRNLIAYSTPARVLELLAENDKLAEALHYPDCWDVAAYPTLASAIDEASHAFKCSAHLAAAAPQQAVPGWKLVPIEAGGAFPLDVCVSWNRRATPPAELKPCLNEIINSGAQARPKSCPRCGLAKECPAGVIRRATPSAEVSDEGLPKPEPDIKVDLGMGAAKTGRYYSTTKVRQAQREAIAADRQKRGDK